MLFYRTRTKNFLIAFLFMFAISFPVTAKAFIFFEETLKFYEQLLSDSPQARKSETWDIVGRKFYDMYLQNPGEELAPHCLFLAAQVHYDKTIRFDSPRDEEKAFQYLLEFLQRYPAGHELADNSWFLVGQIHERRGEKRLAAEAYRVVVNGISDPDTYKTARERLGILSQLPKSFSSGTGFLISGEKGLILTNEHVVGNCGRIQVIAGKNRTKMPSSVISADTENDIALIKVYSEKLWDSDINKWLDGAKTGDVPSIEKGHSAQKRCKIRRKNFDCRFSLRRYSRSLSVLSMNLV